jgi:hypothetical protein
MVRTALRAGRAYNQCGRAASICQQEEASPGAAPQCAPNHDGSSGPTKLTAATPAQHMAICDPGLKGCKMRKVMSLAIHCTSSLADRASEPRLCNHNHMAVSSEPPGTIAKVISNPEPADPGLDMQCLMQPGVEAAQLRPRSAMHEYLPSPSSGVAITPGAQGWQPSRHPPGHAGNAVWIAEWYCRL